MASANNRVKSADGRVEYDEPTETLWIMGRAYSLDFFQFIMQSHGDVIEINNDGPVTQFIRIEKQKLVSDGIYTKYVRVPCNLGG